MTVTVKICTQLPAPATAMPELTRIATRTAEALGVTDGVITMDQEGDQLVLSFALEPGAVAATKTNRPRAAEPATGPVHDGWDAGRRLYDLYGADGGRGHQIRSGRTMLGWWLSAEDGATYYILKDGTHAGPFNTIDEAERDAKRKAAQ